MSKTNRNYSITQLTHWHTLSQETLDLELYRVDQSLKALETKEKACRVDIAELKQMVDNTQGTIDSLFTKIKEFALVTRDQKVSDSFINHKNKFLAIVENSKALNVEIKAINYRIKVEVIAPMKNDIFLLTNNKGSELLAFNYLCKRIERYIYNQEVWDVGNTGLKNNEKEFKKTLAIVEESKPLLLQKRAAIIEAQQQEADKENIALPLPQLSF